MKGNCDHSQGMQKLTVRVLVGHFSLNMYLVILRPERIKWDSYHLIIKLLKRAVASFVCMVHASMTLTVALPVF